ncbi:MAG: hypothetical protein EOO24_14940, partial [Comamonadaceae bacterium]
AFDRTGLARTFPRPTVAVASGLYELVADNEAVARSLAGVGDAVEDGGYLVYTGRSAPGIPAGIEAVMAGGAGGSATSLARRGQAGIDRLVEAAGFRKIAQRIDDWGLLTVSLAVRTGH